MKTFIAKITKKTGKINVVSPELDTSVDESKKVEVIADSLESLNQQLSQHCEGIAISIQDYEKYLLTGRPIVEASENYYSRSDNRYWVSIAIKNAERVLSEHIARGSLESGQHWLFGIVGAEIVGKPVPRAPQLICTGIMRVERNEDYEDVYINTLLAVKENPEYTWLDDEDESQDIGDEKQIESDPDAVTTPFEKGQIKITRYEQGINEIRVLQVLKFPALDIALNFLSEKTKIDFNHQIEEINSNRLSSFDRMEMVCNGSVGYSAKITYEIEHVPLGVYFEEINNEPKPNLIEMNTAKKYGKF